MDSSTAIEDVKAILETALTLSWRHGKRCCTDVVRMLGVASPQVDGSTAIEDVKAILEAETGIPSAQQALVYGTRLLADG